MMAVVFVAVLGGLIAWIGWLWRRTRAPVWTSLVALVPVALGAWCVIAMAAAFISAYRVPETLTAVEQVRQVAALDARGYRWGMRFWAAGLASAGWLLFVMWRWEALDAPPQGTPGKPPHLE
jgi:hypothetical protein